MKRIIVLTTLLFILISVAAQKKLEPGKLVYTRWGGFWHSGTILDVKKDKYLVHSTGYGPGYDRWVEKKDILLEKPKTKTKPLIASKPSIVTDTTVINKPATETTQTVVSNVSVDKSEKIEPVKLNSVESVVTVKAPVENPKPIPPPVSIDKFEKQELNKQSAANAVTTSATAENKTDINKTSTPASSSVKVRIFSSEENSSAHSSKQTVQTEPPATETKKSAYDSKSVWRTKESTANTANANSTTAANLSAPAPQQTVQPVSTETKTVVYTTKPAWNNNNTTTKKNMYHPTMIGEKLYLRVSVMGNNISVSTIYLGKEDIIIRNPRNGLEPIDLVFEKKYNPSNTGVYKIEGDKMSVIWSDGKPETWKCDYSDIYLYGIDGKTVTAQKAMPVNYTLNKRLQLSGLGKDKNSVTVDFRFDGTFGIVNTTLLASAGGERSVPNNQKGRYFISGNTLQLNFDNRESVRMVICMPVINGKNWLVINNSVFELR